MRVHDNFSLSARLRLGAMLLLGCLLSLVAPVAAQANLGLTKTINGNPATVDTGQIIEYRLQYSCNNLTGTCGVLTVTDVLPPNVTLIDISTGGPSYPFSYDSGTRTVTITNADFLDGSQSEAVIRVRVNYDTPGNTPITNTANGSITIPNQNATGGPVTVTSNAPTEQWSITKTRIRPTGVMPTVDQDVMYQVALCPDTQIGNVSLTNVQIVDTFPTGATVVNADGGSVVGNTITWNIGTLDIAGGGCATRTVVLRYPTASGFAIGQNIPNTASATADIPQMGSVGVGVGTNTIPDQLVNPVQNPGRDKSVSGSPVNFGGLGRFFLTLTGAGSNVPVTNMVMLDTMPPELELTAIETGQWTPVYVNALVEYSTDNITYVPIGTFDGNDDVAFPAPVTNIRYVRWTFSYIDPADGLPKTGIPLDFNTGGGNNRPEIQFTPRTVAPAATAGSTYQNCATFSWTGSGVVPDECANAVIPGANAVNVVPDKSRVGSGNLQPGDLIQFETRLTITERSSLNLIDPTIIDALPDSLLFISQDSITYVNIPAIEQPATPPTLTQAADTINGIPYANTLQWQWTGWTLPRPTSGTKEIVIRFTAQVRPGTIQATYTNTAFFLTDSPGVECETGTAQADVEDIDNDGNTAEIRCQENEAYLVEEAVVLNSQKWIADATYQAAFDPDFVDTVAPISGADCPTPDTQSGVLYTRFPCVAQGFPEDLNNLGETLDDFQYRLVIYNDGNVSGNNYIMYDVLPYVGDTGSGGPLSTTARDSEFQPYLTGAVTIFSLPPGLAAGDITIQYSNSSNPCRGEVFGTGAPFAMPGGCTNDWTAAPGTFTTVRAFRIFFNNPAVTIDALESMIFNVPMRIPNTAQSGQIAWNSFAQRVNNATTGTLLPTSEPRKVGIIVPERLSLGNRVWRDRDNSGTINGTEDATAGVAGVRVELYRDTNTNGVFNPGTDTFIAFDTTDANGFYLFGDLLEGDYFAVVDDSNFTPGQPLEFYISSTGNSTNANDNNDNGLDAIVPTIGYVSNVVPLRINTEVTNETDPSNNPLDGAFFRGVRGESNENSDLTIDFGFYVPMSLGNRVWLDEGGGAVPADRNNGIEDASEANAGIPNVQVRLRTGAGALYDRDPITAGVQQYISTTDINGYYIFDGLGEGNYIVEIMATNFDVVGDPLYPYVSSLGNFVDADPDQRDNGIDDLNYETAGIRSGIINLTRDAEPTGEVQSGNPAHGAGGTGNNAELDRNSDLTVDFGFYLARYSLGNRVWLDGNNSGNIDGADGGAPGIGGVQVRLLDAAGNPADNPNIAGIQDYVLTTDANGYYRFDELNAGDYIVELLPVNFNAGNALSGLASSTGAAQEADPDTNGESNDNGLDTPVGGGIRSAAVTLGPRNNEPLAAVETDVPVAGAFAGQGPTIDSRANMTVDFGFYRAFSLGNRVWLDDNNSGNIDGADGGAPGIANVTLRLLDAAGNPADNPNVTGTQDYTLVTDANGYYRFDNLVAGDYIVEIVASNFTAGTGTLFGHASSTGAAQEADPDSDVDSNDNGIDTPVAGGIRSAAVTLGPGDVEPLAPGVEIDVPGTTPASQQGPMPDVRTNLTVDFGFYPAYVVGNRVWMDNGAGGGVLNDGAQNGGEIGIANVTVALLTGAGAAADNPNLTGTQAYTAVTDANGYYRFDGLPAGDYIVEIAATNFAVGGSLESAINSTGAQQEADPDSNGDQNDNGLDVPVAGAIRSNAVTLGTGNVEPTAPGQETDVPGAGVFAGQGPTIDARSNLTVDFGFVPRFGLGNRVWLDDAAGGGISNDGIRNGGELGIAGVQVQLLDSAGNPADNPNTPAVDTYILTTDANGYYRFDGLPAGDYMVEILAANFGAGQPLNSLGSSTGAEANPNADVDTNDNGIDALPAAAVRSGIVTLGIGYDEPTAPAQETDVPVAGGFPGQGAVDAWANMTVDFGFVRLFSLGNRIWLDNGIGVGGVLNDGRQNGGEPGIGGVTVRLLTGAGTPADNPNIAGVQDYIVTTTPQGYYRFDNLPPGDYIVEIISTNFTGGGTLANMSSSTGAQQEANPNLNGDENDNGLDTPVGGAIRSNPVTLGPLNDEPTAENAPFGQGGPDLQANMTVDFGFVPGQYSLGNRVWIDTDNSGNISGAEVGVDGVTVRLFDGTGATLLQTTTTANGGYYRFDNLAAGNYVVEVAASSFGVGQPLNGLISSTGALQEANPNNDVDSNDNGIDTPFAGATRSNVVSLGPGDSEPTGEIDLAPSGQGALNPRANMTVDFGFITPPTVYSLGNRVWFDADNDGTMNPFDGPTPGIDGVTVNLLNAGGAIVATTTTAGDGYYRFDNLAAGDYIVEIANTNFNTGNPLVNLISSNGALQEANPNSDVDRNDNGLDLPVGGAIRSNPVTLGPGTTEPTAPGQETDIAPTGQGAADNQANMTVDFGFTNATNVYSIGNRVWKDDGVGGGVANNGFQDGTELGIANVMINLLDGTGTTIVATTATDANGYYRFDNLPAGDYRVEIAATNFNAGNPLLGTTSSTGALQEATPNSDGDRNDNGLDVAVAGAIRSGTVTLGPGTSEPINEADLAPTGQGAPDNRANMTVDFGFVDSFSLGNRVWRDDGTGGGVANNGFQEPTEPGIAGVTVRLLDSTGTTQIATTTTDANGHYRFDNLAPGTYIVEVVAGNFTVGNPLNGLTSSPITATDPNTDVDQDDNGIDTPVAGAIRSGQVVLGPTPTEPTGETDLSATGQGPVPDDRANMTVDFGFAPPINGYSLGNRVWLDNGNGGGTANNGFQEPGEIGMVGVVVNLIDNTGINIIGTTVTDAGGYYRFDNLPAGDYFVSVPATNFAVSQPLNGLVSSIITQANPNTDVDQDDNGIDAAPGAEVRSGVVTLGPGNSEPAGETDLSATGQGAADDRANMTVDFGFAAPTTTYSLGNRVWFDTDNDGTLNPADGVTPGIGNVTVRLLDSTGTTVVATTTTDATGYYRFDNLAPGSYIVEIAPSNFTAGQPLQGFASSNGAGQEATPDSDGDSNDNGLDTFVAGAIRSGTVTLGPGNSEPTGELDLSATGQGAADDFANMTVDFGFTTSYSLGNRVWFDTNNDSLITAGEVGIANVRVEAYRDTDASGTYTPGDVLINAVNTDGTGYYLFTGLAGGDYVVVIPASNFDAAGDPLFGYFSSATTRNPADGLLNETAAPDPDNDFDSDDNGTTNGTLGTATGYVTSLVVTLGPGGSEPLAEPDPTSATFTDPSTDDRSNTTVDFGFYTMGLGNIVWFDADDNGIINGTEAGLDGVTLELYPVGNLGGPPLATTITASGGQYRFPGLAAGEYVVRIPGSNFGGVLAGFTSSTGGPGNPFETAPGVDPDNGVDSDDNGVHTAGPNTTVTSDRITLIPGGAGTVIDNATGRTVNNTLDFGMASATPLVFSLGNRVFRDFDNNGAQDASEPGIPGVQVRLLDTANNPVDDPNIPGVQDYIVTTDASGYYRFDNLPAGDYIVQILPVNFNVGSALDGQNSSGPDEILPNNDVDRNDNGIGTLPLPGLGIVSGVVTLGVGEPVGETDIGTGGQGAVDNRANMTVDFGFTPPIALLIDKDDGMNSILVGTFTTYTVNIFNNTPVPQNNVTFTDNIPTGIPSGYDPATITWTCSSTPAGLCPTTSGTTATISELFPVIPAGARIIYRITAQLRPCVGVGCAATITNVAQLSTGQTDDDVNGVIYDPPVGSKTGTVTGGNGIRWEMTWINTGGPQAVVINDPIAAGQAFAGNLSCVANGTSVQTSCSFAGNTVTWTGTIGTGAANTVVISFDVTVAGAGDYDNDALLTEPGTNVRVNARARVTIGGGGGTGAPGGGSAALPISITITPNPPFGAPGSNVDWTVDINNPNPFPLDNVEITVTLPPELIILGVDAPPGAIVTIEGNTVRVRFPSLAAGNTRFTIRTRVDPNAKLPFALTVTGRANICPCEASATLLSVSQLPATGEPHTISFSGLLAIGSMAGITLTLVAVIVRRQLNLQKI